MTATEPDAEQLDALKAYAKQKGRYWKQALRDDWYNACAKVSPELSGPLQQVRNTLGPTWLNRFRLPQFTVNCGPGKNRHFGTLKEASQFCQQEFARTGIVLSIVPK